MKKLSIVIILALFFLVSCTVPQAESNNDIPERMKIAVIRKSYMIDDFTSLGLWCMSFDMTVLENKIKKAERYYFILNDQTIDVKRNSVNDDIMMVYVSERFSKESIEQGVLSTRASPATMKRTGDEITLHEVIVERTEVQNETNLYELLLSDYISMKVSENPFVYQDNKLIRPSYVKSNEENAYSIKYYYDAKQVCTDHTVNGAFEFLKEQPDHEKNFLYFDNPNRLAIENETITVSKPDERDRMRQLGAMGELTSTATYTYDVVDDPVTDEHTLSFKRDNLPTERYRKSVEFEIQINEATICLFYGRGSDLFDTIIPYATTKNTELIKNARFTSTLPSTSTNIRLINGDKKILRLVSEPATVVKAANGTTAEQLLSEITSDDGRQQTYRLYDDTGTLSSTDEILNDATLTVTSEWGEEYVSDYSVIHIDTYFVRLETAGFFSWHDTIQNAVDVAANGSIITVYEGEYKESVDISATAVHLKTENPTDTSVRDKTIINANGKDDAAVLINTELGNGWIVEGFTITTGSSNGYPGIYIGNIAPVIRYNCIINNVNEYGGGIHVKTSNNLSARTGTYPRIYNNLIENNSAIAGGGIYLGNGIDVQIYDNVIRNNDASNSGGGIYVGQGSVVKNKADQMWKAHLLPGTTDDITEIENTDDPNSFISNTINSDSSAEGATVHFTRTQAPSESDVVVHSYANWARVYGFFSGGDIARLFTYEASQTEVASATFDMPTGSRNLGDYIQIAFDIQEDTEYFVTLQSFDLNRNVQSTKVATVSINTPATPTLVSPIDDTYFLSIPVTFSWDAAADATSYNLLLGTNRSNIALFSSGITDTEYATDALDEFQEYFWQIESVDRYGVKRVSDVWDFITHSTAFAGGDGTSGNPFQVNTADQLNAIRNNYLGDSAHEYYFKQTANISLSGFSNWDPIGGTFQDGSSERFYSHYDGNGFNISNMKFNRTGEFHGGLISILYGSLKRVRLIDCDAAGKAQTGSVVGTNEGVIENCSASGIVSGTAQYIGGLVGVNGGTIKDSFFQGTVSGKLHTGGFVGLNQGNIENSYTTASATSQDNFAGGFVAYTDRGLIENCYSTGSVTADGSYGGFIGHRSGCIVSNCFWDKESSGLVISDGGTDKTTSEMKTDTTFTDASWDFSAKWNMRSGTNNGYPYLRNTTPF